MPGFFILPIFPSGKEKAFSFPTAGDAPRKRCWSIWEGFGALFPRTCISLGSSPHPGELPSPDPACGTRTSRSLHFLGQRLFRNPREELGSPGGNWAHSCAGFAQEILSAPQTEARPCSPRTSQPLNKEIKLFHAMASRRFRFLPFPGGVRAGETEGCLGLCKAGEGIANKTSHPGMCLGYLPSSLMWK